MRRLATYLFATIAMILGLSSCTYDYFEDEMNYKVFVPEFKDKSIDNCRILIWNTETGELVAERFARVNETGDNLLDDGIFAFHLPPGSYKSCVLANTDSVGFYDKEDLAYAAFCLDRKESGHFKSPGPLKFDYINRSLDLVDKMVTDTASIKMYPATLTLRYRGNDVDPHLVGSAKITLEFVGTEQKVALDTLTSGVKTATIEYPFREINPFPISAEGAAMEFNTLVFPTMEDSLVVLTLELYDPAGKRLITYRFGLYAGNEPLRMLYGRRYIIDLYNEGFYITIEGWDETILGGEIIIDGGQNKKKGTLPTEIK